MIDGASSFCSAYVRSDVLHRPKIVQYCRVYSNAEPEVNRGPLRAFGPLPHKRPTSPGPLGPSSSLALFHARSGHRRSRVSVLHS